MVISALVHDAVVGGIGFVAGAFTPAVGRKIKSFFSKEGAVVKADAKSEVKAVEKKL